MFAFDDAQVGILARAFARAWDTYLKTRTLTPQNLAESRAILAGRILRAAHFGQWDEWRLARDAVEYLWDLRFRGKPLRVVPPPAKARKRKQVPVAAQPPAHTPLDEAPVQPRPAAGAWSVPSGAENRPAA
jgi:hypothetical protein